MVIKDVECGTLLTTSNALAQWPYRSAYRTPTLIVRGVARVITGVALTSTRRLVAFSIATVASKCCAIGYEAKRSATA